MRKCDSCGKLYQETKDVFCPHCGAVAVKQCTHGSSFDSGRYDRGEIYKNSNTRRQNTTYNQGYEPHVQRDKSQYNKSQDAFDNNGKYTADLSKINLPDFKKMMPKVNKKGNPKIGIIVFVCVLGLNILLNTIGSSQDYSEEDNWSDVTMQEIIDGEVYTLVKNASVELVEDEDGVKTFDICIENMCFSDDAIGYSPEIEEQIVNGDVFAEIDVCAFSENPVPENDFNDALSESYFIPGSACDEIGRYQFKYDFDYDEIIHLNCGMYLYFENDTRINAELPFGAFSIAEDGTVTYYTSFASDETDWATVFEECSNEANVDNYSGYISFSEE